jgi:hypothetical protein
MTITIKGWNGTERRMGDSLVFNTSDIYEEYADESRNNINKQFSKDDIRDNLTNHPVFSYYWIDLGKTNYHFHQDEFDNEDIKKYFSILNKFSKMTIGDILDSKHNYHVYESKLKGNLLKVYKKYTNKTDINLFQIPPIYHFGFYTCKDGHANRDNRIKSPRIYFTIGSFGIIHLLFYDPYHEINP